MSIRQLLFALFYSIVAGLVVELLKRFAERWPAEVWGNPIVSATVAIAFLLFLAASILTARRRTPPADAKTGQLPRTPLWRRVFQLSPTGMAFWASVVLVLIYIYLHIRYSLEIPTFILLAPVIFNFAREFFTLQFAKQETIRNLETSTLRTLGNYVTESVRSVVGDASFNVRCIVKLYNRTKTLLVPHKFYNMAADREAGLSHAPGNGISGIALSTKREALPIYLPEPEGLYQGFDVEDLPFVRKGLKSGWATVLYDLEGEPQGTLAIDLDCVMLEEEVVGHIRNLVRDFAEFFESIIAFQPR